MSVLAADLGGTHFRAAVVADDGTLILRYERPSPTAGEDAAGAVLNLLQRAAEAAPERPRAACIATAGLVNTEEGRVIFAPNIPAFRNVALAGPAAERLGMPVSVENDASAAALGEFRFGAGRGYRHLIHATLGTGIGGGLIIDGRLYRGAKGLAGEIGHVILDPAGPVCNCGSRGCLEAMVSGTAFAGRARHLIAAGRSPRLAELAGGGPPGAVHLLAAARAGDALAEAEIRHGGHLLGLALGSLVNVLNPHAVTLSGGLLAMEELLLDPLREAMFSFAYGPAAGTTLRIGELGDDGGLLGAAAVALTLVDC